MVYFRVDCLLYTVLIIAVTFDFVFSSFFFGVGGGKSAVAAKLLAWL